MYLNYIYNNFSRINTFLRFIHKSVLKMETAYFRHEEGSEYFYMVFKYRNSPLGIDREFNFKRQMSESVDMFLNRVSVNVQKILMKKIKKKKDKTLSTEVPGDKEIDVQLLKNKVPIDRSMSCKEIFMEDNNLNLKLADQIFKIVLNAPWVDKITLPTSILAGFPVYPNKFDTFSVLKDKSDFLWHKKLPKTTEWFEIGKGYIYLPSVDDIGYVLKLVCVPRNEKTSGPLFEVESDVLVEAGPGQCPFEIRHNFTKEKCLDKGSFRVLTYNLLADLYCDSDYSREVLYPYCPSYALEIDYRKQLFLKEIIGYNADVICLQEVDEKIFDFDILPVMSTLGFSGVFAKKGGQTAEGLCCLYNNLKFRCMSAENVILGEQLNTNEIFKDIWQKIESNKPLCERILSKPTALQIMVLESIETPNELLIVSNIHLYFHPDADHIRLLQSGLSVNYIESVVKNLNEKYPNKRTSVIFCGDFNSVPECGIFKLLTTGYVPDDFVDWSSNADEAVKNVSLSQSLPFDSAYGTPKYTNYTVGFADCLDYIFYQKDALFVIQVVPLPSEEEIKANVALPSVVFPSDHIALVSDLKWK